MIRPLLEWLEPLNEWQRPLNTWQSSLDEWNVPTVNVDQRSGSSDNNNHAPVIGVM